MCMCVNRLWVGLGTGKILVVEFELDTDNHLICNVTIVLEFQAHHNSAIHNLIIHKKNTTGNETVASVTHESVKFWDGLLLELHALRLLFEKEEEYSSFTKIRIQLITFNIDSRKPIDMDANAHDKETFDKLFETESDIYIFGFQELVDLENVIWY
jgi:hypothetical protein